MLRNTIITFALLSAITAQSLSDESVYSKLQDTISDNAGTLVVSPLSHGVCFSMLLLGAKGGSEEKILRNYFIGDTKQNVISNMPKYWEEFNAKGDRFIFSHFVLSSTYQPKSSFKHLFSNTFHQPLDNEPNLGDDFKEKYNKKAEGKGIRELITETDEKSKAGLLCGLKMIAEFPRPMRKSRGKFHNADGQTPDVEYLSGSINGNVKDAGKFKTAKVGMKDDMSLYLVIANGDYDIYDVFTELNSENPYYNIEDNEGQSISLKIPKFTLTSQRSDIDGYGFHPSDPEKDFKMISNTKLESVDMHESLLFGINSKTRARRSSRSPSTNFNADKPFLFFLRHEPTGSTVAAGFVRNIPGSARKKSNK